MQLTYLGLLAAAIGGSYIVSNRGNLGKMAQQAAIWGFIFLGVVAAYGLWGDVSRDVTNRQSVIGEEVIIPQSPDGHYYIALNINGNTVDFVVDTGASQVVLSQLDARRVGINPADLPYLGVAYTANGTVRTADVELDRVSIGPYTDTGVRAVVNEGDMAGSLLGMTYLNLYDNFAISNGELILSRRN